MTVEILLKIGWRGVSLSARSGRGSPWGDGWSEDRQGHAATGPILLLLITEKEMLPERIRELTILPNSNIFLLNSGLF